MAKKQAGELGFRQTYKQTGAQSSGGGPAAAIDKGQSGSHRDGNAKRGLAQCKLKNANKVGPDKNLNEIGGGNFY